MKDEKTVIYEIELQRGEREGVKDILSALEYFLTKIPQGKMVIELVVETSGTWKCRWID